MIARLPFWVVTAEKTVETSRLSLLGFAQYLYYIGEGALPPRPIALALAFPSQV